MNEAKIITLAALIDQTRKLEDLLMALFNRGELNARHYEELETAITAATNVAEGLEEYQRGLDSLSSGLDNFREAILEIEREEEKARSDGKYMVRGVPRDIHLASSV